MKYKNLSERNGETTLIAGVQIVNACIGVIATLLCILAYMTIKSKVLKYALIAVVVLALAILFVWLFVKENIRHSVNENAINKIQLINENNEIIKEWPIIKKTSVVIGKGKDSGVDIDLMESVYSNLIGSQHAVMNYAGGNWYIEDICSDNGVSIQKTDDGLQYRLVKYSPCKIKKGDIVFIGKTKLLLI